MEIVTAAAGVIGKAMAKPATDAALRKEAVIRALKAVRLDPKVPPQDFGSLYAYTLIEYCTGRGPSVLAFFRDEFVLDAFRRSFADGDFRRLRDEAAHAVERNRESHEFGHLEYAFEDHLDGFIKAFHTLVDRSRAPHETRLEQKVDALLQTVGRTRAQEETHRARTDPKRAGLSPAQRLMRDAQAWFTAVGYEIRRSFETPDGSAALLVDIPQRHPGRFDRTVVLCVEGELVPHHMHTLHELVTSHQASEGWGLARLRVSQAARRRAADSSDVLFCYSFDELVDLEADFEPYITWVEEEVRRRGIDTRYVPVSCSKDEIDPSTQRRLDTSIYRWQDGGLDDYVASWLQEPAKRHLSVLGEFGMGKSWFALHLAGEMARGWRDAKRKGVPRPRIPLLIPLRDYAKQTTVQGLLSEFFFNKHKINLRNSDVLQVLNGMGRLLLIFDGFDEMAARVDRSTIVNNFWELAGAAAQPGAKVLLSSRKEHFRDAQEARDLFSAKVSVSARTAGLQEGPAFDIVELIRFDDEQIKRMLAHDLSEEQVERVMEHDDVRELMGRPGMSGLVVEALPEIERGADVDLARVYLYAIRRKLDRDMSEERTFTSRADKLFFLCEVAWEMLDSNRLSLNYRDFPDRLRSCFGPAVQSAKDLDYWEQDMRNQGMLVRNAEGDYGPSHKSLLEFLVAYKFAGELGLLSGDFLAMLPTSDTPDGDREWTWSRYFAERAADGKLPALREFAAEPVEALARTFGALGGNEAVLQFMASMVRERADHADRLLNLARATTRIEAGSLAAQCLHLMVRTGNSLENARIGAVNLTGFNPWPARDGVSLAGADLRGASLEGAYLRGVGLSGADLTGARLGNDELLESGQLWESGLIHPSGAVVLQLDGGQVLHWPEGRVDVPPHHLTVDESVSSAALSQWDSTAWWCGGRRNGRIVNVATGDVIGTTAAGLYGNIARWQGRWALVEIDFVAWHATLTDCQTQELVEQVPLPPGSWKQAHFVFTGASGLSAVLLGESGIYAGVADGNGKDLWRTLVREEKHLPGNVMGINSLGGAAMVGFDGQLNLVLDPSAPACLCDVRGLPAPELPFDDFATILAFRAMSGMAAAAVGRDLVAWRLGAYEKEPAWSIRQPSRVAKLLASPDGERLAVISAIGELSVCDFRTGQVLSRTMLSNRLNGTRFSRDCGLDHDILDAVVRAGGVIVDEP
ncbi:NACHT domain-containing protein [Streptomyces sp. NPDC003737]|uniref:NACHT domain-containing protein n=1 Tax=Streptomyces sp. NPDC003737 TaxID=3364685 RepID=UPI0036B979B7